MRLKDNSRLENLALQLTQDQHFVPSDYLDLIVDQENRDAIATLKDEREAGLYSDKMQSYRKAAESIQSFQPSTLNLDAPIISIGTATDIESPQSLESILKTFCPWKKGPFNVFGTLIDAEWRSDLKWDRLRPHITPLENRTVADIGCHNGYFMFRMNQDNPKRVIGFEPVPKHFWNFQLLQNLIRCDRLNFELLGVEHIHYFSRFFDSIFCLGILYHHTDPVGLLRKIHQALAPKGELIVDCQGIPGDRPVALTPAKRYAKAKGIWFLPTQSCLENWIRRAGFQKIKVVFAEPLSTQEQRRTDWANIDSLAEFLNPHDPSLTIEGYPAPWRFYAIAQKG